MGLNVGRPAMHQPVAHAVKLLADFMAFQPSREGFKGSPMIRQVQFLGGQLMACLIFGLKESLAEPDSGQFPF